MVEGFVGGVMAGGGGELLYFVGCQVELVVGCGFDVVGGV